MERCAPRLDSAFTSTSFVVVDPVGYPPTRSNSLDMGHTASGRHVGRCARNYLAVFKCGLTGNVDAGT